MKDFWIFFKPTACLRSMKYFISVFKCNTDSTNYCDDHIKEAKEFSNKCLLPVLKHNKATKACCCMNLPLFIAHY